MLTVTVDTNLLPIDDLVASVPSGEFEFAVVSVTDREVEGSVGLAPSARTPRLSETAVWGESRWGEAVWGGASNADCLERALAVIGDGSFPSPNQRGSLSDGQARQLRDAMILCAHVREKRSIFLTGDERAFVKHDRRAELETLFGTRILTKDEFLSRYGTT